GGSMVGRMLPFGIGAVVGAVVNSQMARQVSGESKEAFGAAPTIFPIETDPEYAAPTTDRRLLATLQNVSPLVGKLRKNRATESTVVEPTDDEDLESPVGLPRTYTGDERHELGKIGRASCRERE